MPSLGHFPVHIYVVCYNESAMIRQTFDFYKRQFGNPTFYLLDNHSTDDSVAIAKTYGAIIVPWGHKTHKDNKFLAFTKNTIWKVHQQLHQSRWVLVCDMDEWLLIPPEQLHWEEQQGTTLLCVKGYQMVANSHSADLSDLALTNITHGYADDHYSKTVMFLTPLVYDINYQPGCHICSPQGITRFSRNLYKLGHFKFIGLDFLIGNYSCNFKRTHTDRKQKMSTHYSNDVQTIARIYFDACKKGNLDVSDCNHLNKPMHHRFLIFVPYCIFFKPYIRKCLESIQNQTYQKYTVVVVDDGYESPEFMTTLGEEFDFILLTHTTRQGPAASKWTFLQYVQKGLQSGMYTENDIICIIDGDDYLCTVCALSIIHNRYLDTKCMGTFGESIGNFCKNACDAWRTRSNDTVLDVRKKWMFNHPRTFKAELANQFQKRDFQQDETELWLTKCTDRPIVYGMFDHFGADNIQHIDQCVYYYREHTQNTYKVVSQREKHRQFEAILKRPSKSPRCEDIHIVMCCWKRVANLEKQFENMNTQTVAKRIVFHLVNNNIDNQELLQQKVDAQMKLTSNVLRIVLTHWSNKHNCFERFYYIRDHLVCNNVNYVIIIDDDQRFANNWVEQLYKKRTPKRFITWYGRHWNVRKPISYWKDSHVNHSECIQHKKKHITQFHYGGPCGCIIDTQIFSTESELWTLPKLPDGLSVFTMDDIWLSFVLKHIYKWTIERSFLPETANFNNESAHSNEQSLWHQLKTQKTQFLHHLINKYKWNLLCEDAK